MGQQLIAVYEDGVFRPLEPVDLEEHQRVRLAVEVVATQAQETSHKPIWEVAVELTRAIPDSELEKLPRDGAAQHDHYLYGAPKRD